MAHIRFFSKNQLSDAVKLLQLIEVEETKQKSAKQDNKTLHLSLLSLICQEIASWDASGVVKKSATVTELYDMMAHCIQYSPQVCDPSFELVFFRPY